MQRVILDWSLIAAIGTMVAWGMNFVFVKYVLDNLGFGAFMFLRFLVLPLLGLALLVVDLPPPHRPHLAETRRPAALPAVRAGRPCASTSAR